MITRDNTDHRWKFIITNMTTPMKGKVVAFYSLFIAALFFQPKLCAQKSLYYNIIDKGNIDQIDSLGRQGVWLSYTVNGDDLELDTYKNNRRNGISLGFIHIISPISDTVLQSVVNYKNDTLNGEYKTYYESGKIQESSNINMGNLEGLSTHYYYTGQPYFQRYCRIAMVDSFIRVFDKGGHIKFEKFFNKDVEGIDAAYKILNLIAKEGGAFPTKNALAIISGRLTENGGTKNNTVITGHDLLEISGLIFPANSTSDTLRIYDKGKLAMMEVRDTMQNMEYRYVYTRGSKNILQKEYVLKNDRAIKEIIFKPDGTIKTEKKLP